MALSKLLLLPPTFQSFSYSYRHPSTFYRTFPTMATFQPPLLLAYF